ncbi:MAG: exosortase/archaeosortase family protein [Bacteroidales bacterium]
MKIKKIPFFDKVNLSAGKIFLSFLILAIIATKILLHKRIEIIPVSYFLNLYSDILIAISQVLLQFSNTTLIFNYESHQIINSLHTIKVDVFYFSVNQILTAILIILITKSPIKFKILYLIFTMLIFTVYNSIRLSLHVLWPETISVHHWIFNIFLIPRWLLVLLIVHLYWKKFPSLKELIMNKFNFSNKFIHQSFIKIACLVILYYFVVIIAFNNFFFINGRLLVDFVLNTSKYWLENFGYPATVSGKYITGPGAVLYMDDACLGIDLMFLFASFIGMMPGPVRHKIWFIPTGISVIIILNCLRVILIFVNTTNHNGYTLPFEIHDVFTYPVLVFTFLMWVIWINRFYKRNQVEQKVLSQQ